MKILITIFFFTAFCFPQDRNNDGKVDVHDFLPNHSYDLNGDGVNDNLPFQFSDSHNLNQPLPLLPALNFSQLWTSPAGAFTNCWDGAVGYFDGDTLLDVAGFTFSPAKFYIWEQSPARPDSFYLVQEFIKSEGGSFAPITFGDTDGDNKIEIIAADVLGICRVYVYECDGNNLYVDKMTQTSIVHTSNSQGGQGIYIGDMNKNGRKEIIVMRGTSSPGGGEVRVWEQTGASGSNTYTSIYSYTTVSYLFGKGGFGDSDNDGWDEVILTYGGLPTFNTFIRRIEFDSVSSTFQHLQFEAASIGFPASYKVYDFDNNGVKELVMTGNSNGSAACFVFRSNGANSFQLLHSIFEPTDNNNMLSGDIKVLSGNPQPVILMGSFNGRVYTYQYNGSSFVKDYENLNYPGAAIRRVYWLPTSTYDGYFNTWSGTNSNGTFYIFKRDLTVGIINNQTPVNFTLSQNYPNPFNPNTKIEFRISKSGFATLKVYDILSREITTLVNEQLSPGTYEVDFDGTNYPSGVYYYKLSVSTPLDATGYTETKKMVLIK